MKTKEEVEASPIFRIVKKGLMRKYPWIKKVMSSDDESVQKYTSMLFLEVDIDIKELADQQGWTLEPWVTDSKVYSWRGNKFTSSPYLGILVSNLYSDQARDLQNEIDSDIKRMQKSDVIPSEYKIDKTLGISNFIYYYPTPQPDNTTITN
jgi:hypothetical protein